MPAPGAKGAAALLTAMQGATALQARRGAARRTPKKRSSGAAETQRKGTLRSKSPLHLKGGAEAAKQVDGQIKPKQRWTPPPTRQPQGPQHAQKKVQQLGSRRLRSRSRAVPDAPRATKPPTGAARHARQTDAAATRRATAARRAGEVARTDGAEPRQQTVRPVAIGMSRAIRLVARPTPAEHKERKSEKLRANRGGTR